MTVRRKLEFTAEAYERGRMMREDSEVEIDLFDDGTLWVSDYSESRGSSEPVEKICDDGEKYCDAIENICDKHGWCYCL